MPGNSNAPAISNFIQNMANMETQLDTQLAFMIAQKDPKQVYQLAEDGLSKGLSNQIINALTKLQVSDKELAGKLLDDMIKKVKSTDIVRDQQAQNTAFTFARTITRPSMQDPNTPVNNVNNDTNSDPPLAPFNDQSIKDLLDYLGRTALTAMSNGLTPPPANSRPGTPSRLPFSGMRVLLPAFDKFVPSQGQALRAKFGQLTQTLDPDMRWSMEFGTLQQTNGSVEAMLDVASKAPANQRNSMYEAISVKMADQGDVDKAKQIIDDNISDSNVRKNMLSRLDNVAASKAIRDGKIGDARQMIAQAKTDAERLRLLINLAVSVSNNDRKMAIQLLEEARAVYGPRVETLSQLNGQLQLASAYSQLDPSKSFEIMEPVIDPINAIV